MDCTLEQELIEVAHAWDRAMVENDAEAIGRYMADDWIIVGPDGSIGDKPTFLGLVKSGALTHDVMTSEDLNVRVYRDTAVVTARAASPEASSKAGPSTKWSARPASLSNNKDGGGAS